MNIFITGGTGSLGIALIKPLLEQGHTVTVFSRDEVKQGELRALYPHGHIKCVLGDVRDADWLDFSIGGHELVIHAAAYKQVPAAEVNAGAAIETNVIGSRNVARAAVRNSVHRVIGISTDKACAPINCYGETKALMEKLFQEACMWSNTTNFTLVRYGNVLGSRGSVVPLFYKQIQEGAVTITDPTMTRFWLTLDDAVELVLDAMLVQDRGVIVVPKAPASDMQTLLYAVEGIIPSSKHWVNQNWSSLRKYTVKDIGIRPGEKLHECLVHRGESAHTTEDAPRNRFYIFPAYAGHQGNLPKGYEYTSDTADQLSVTQLVEMIGCYP